MRRDPTVSIRLIDLLSSGPPDSERSLLRLASMLGVSKGCVEYHIRELRRSGEIERDNNGVLRVLDRRRQLPLGLNFNPDNVCELSEVRAMRQLADTAVGYCDLVVQMRVPSTRSAAEIIELLEGELGSRDIHVFIETPPEKAREERTG